MTFLPASLVLIGLVPPALASFVPFQATTATQLQATAGTGSAQATGSAETGGRILDAGSYGVSASADPHANARGLQRAFDELGKSPGGGVLVLPSGRIALDGDLVIPFVDGDSGRYRQQVGLRGSGYGQNGTWLHFSRGSLRVRAANHVISDLRVSSDDGDAIVIEGRSGANETAPARSSMQNVRAEDSRGSGIVMSGTWIYLMQNVYARNNGKWGLEGRAGSGAYAISSNAWTIIGGEFQGNGGADGSGGGINTGRAVQFTMVGSTIEGNKGDGLRIAEQARGVGLYNVYFEANGSRPSNRDIVNDRPSNAAFGPTSVTIIGANFTAAAGRNIEHAIDLTDVTGLRIVSPQFFGSGRTAYAREVIAVSETVPGRATGWVETPYIGWSGYDRPIVANDTMRFGKPVISNFAPNLRLSPGQGGNDGVAVATMALGSDSARQVDVEVIAGAGDWSAGKAQGGAAGNATLRTFYRRGPAGTAFATKDATLDFGRGSAEARTISSNSGLPDNASGFVTIGLARGSDNMAAPVTIAAVKVTTYEAVIGE